MLRFLLALILLSAILPAVAAEHQRLDALREAAERYLNSQLANYGDKASFEIGKLDNRLNLAACDKLDVQLAAGNRLVGNSALKIQCLKGAKWAVNLPVAISIQAEYLVTSHALPGGHELVEADLERRTGDLSQLPSSAITALDQAVGYTVLGGIAAGMPLRSDLLRPPYAVKANDTVKVIARGEGFEVASEGRAMTSASEGQQVSVKMISGAVVKGVAKSGGTVEIAY